MAIAGFNAGQCCGRSGDWAHPMSTFNLVATALILTLPAVAIAITSRCRSRTPVDTALAFCSWALSMPIAMLLGAVLAGVFIR